MKNMISEDIAENPKKYSSNAYHEELKDQAPNSSTLLENASKYFLLSAITCATYFFLKSSW